MCGSSKSVVHFQDCFDYVRFPMNFSINLLISAYMSIAEIFIVTALNL